MFKLTVKEAARVAELYAKKYEGILYHHSNFNAVDITITDHLLEVVMKYSDIPGLRDMGTHYILDGNFYLVRSTAGLLRLAGSRLGKVARLHHHLSKMFFGTDVKMIESGAYWETETMILGAKTFNVLAHALKFVGPVEDCEQASPIIATYLGIRFSIEQKSYNNYLFRVLD